MADRLKTPTATASYPHLFEPQAVDNQPGAKKSYSVALLFNEEAQATPEFKAMKQKAKETGIAKFGPDFESKVLSGELHWPFGKDKKNKYPDIKNVVIVNVRSDTAPGVVSNRKGTDGKPTVITKEQQTVGNPDELYAGCQVKASVTVYAFAKTAKKGVSFGLANIQKVGEGKRIDNRVAAEDDFEASLTETPASLDDVL